MKHLLLLLALLVPLASGCVSTDRAHHRRYPDRPRHEHRRADPVVGRTTDGRRIFEDRRGRLYTRDRFGRRVYRDHDYRDRDYRTRRVVVEPRVKDKARRHRHFPGCEHD